MLRNIKGAEYVSPIVISLERPKKQGVFLLVCLFNQPLLSHRKITFALSVFKGSFLSSFVSQEVLNGLLAGKNITAHNYIFTIVLFINFPPDKSK